MAGMTCRGCVAIADAALVCTMAANNETGVISDLDGIADVLAGSPALWLVDGVQALGKLDLRLAGRRIDYAPFSGHKLYAPKGIGMLYVREGAPFTPLMAGGGQEDSQRAGTENMAGIAALGAVLRELQAGDTFASMAALEAQRSGIATALRESFPGVTSTLPRHQLADHPEFFGARHLGKGIDRPVRRRGGARQRRVRLQCGASRAELRAGGDGTARMAGRIGRAPFLRRGGERGLREGGV